ncbi:transposase [Streptomyces sp. NPDC059165]|uniref:transposase n=1 Tax=Streptomyces sp. NPDC059165 TaxID=3346751 RepID=UPI003685E815
MTIPGVDAMSAVTVPAAVGDFHRFGSADKLVSYLGLNPRVHQSGGTPAHHGRITFSRPALLGFSRPQPLSVVFSARTTGTPTRGGDCRSASVASVTARACAASAFAASRAAWPAGLYTAWWHAFSVVFA